MTDHIINDLDIRGPFTVYASNIGHYVYSFLDPAGPGDIPPDIACLPVLAVRSVPCSTWTMLEIETEV